MAALSGVNLLWRMRRVLWENRNSADIYHLNWLQSLIPFWNIPKPAVATILGSDFQLLGSRNGKPCAPGSKKISCHSGAQQ